jgi:cytochrome c556
MSKAKWIGGIAALTLALQMGGTTMAPAQDAGSPAAAIEKRQAAMKKVGGASRTINGMVRGTAPYDGAAAAEAFRTMNEVAKVYGGYFPQGSESGGDTEALPAIWENKADFEAKLAKFASDTAAAAAAATQGEDAFKAAARQVGENCGSCHKAYRAPS